MNGINRRSQKVVCVFTIELLNASTGQVIPLKQRPKEDGIYTVDDFIDNTGLVNPEDAPAITLMEITTPIAKMPDGSRRPFGWPIAAFRPLIEDKPSAEVIEMLERIKREAKPQLEPTHISIGSAGYSVGGYWR